MTLIETVIVITILGVLAAGIALFIRRPIEGYFDAVRRTELSDIADTTLRRMSRDIRTALSNSVRTTIAGGAVYLEYLQTSGGGRYRADVDSGGLGNTLDFSAADTAFDVLGPAPVFTGGESIVVFNLGPGFVTADAYSGGNRTTFAGIAGNTISIASKQFPFPSPGNRFSVVQYPVTYECTPNLANPAAGTIRRYWNYPISAGQPTPPAGGSNALLANNVASCSFTYAAVNQRVGLVTLTLGISSASAPGQFETVQMFHQVHVGNAP